MGFFFNKTIFQAIKYLMMSFFIILFLSSCVQDTGSTKKTKKSASSSTNGNSNPTISNPNYNSDINYVQDGASIYNNTIPVDVKQADALYLRGKSIHNYIKLNPNAINLCLVGRISDSTVNKIFVAALKPQFFYNFTTQVKESYYLININDEEANKTQCQKTGLINKLNSQYPTFTAIKYSLTSVCETNCTKTTYSTETLDIFNNSGTSLQNTLITSNLLFKIANSKNISNDTTNSCSTSSECVARGYSCCSEGQCVKDLDIKSNINQSSLEFLQAQNDVLSNPRNIYNYPQFYYICSQATTTPTNPTQPVDSTKEAQERISKLTTLYTCLNKVEGEMGVCSIDYENPKLFDTTKTIVQNESQGTGVYSTRADDRGFKSTFSNTNSDKLPNFTIEKITYGGQVLYLAENYLTNSNNNKVTTLSNQYVTINPSLDYNIANLESEFTDDSLTSPTKVILKKLPSGTTFTNNILSITYRVDSSCTNLNSNLAKCEKHYIQGQNSSSGSTKLNLSRQPVTDHFTGSMEAQNFKLPSYVDVDKAITVTLDGQTLKVDNDWILVKQNPQSYVQLLGLRTASNSQKVKITFYVDRLNYPAIGISKQKARESVQQNCKCSGDDCNIKPVYNSSNTIVDFQCIFPQPDIPEPPLNQKVFLSSKSVPVRFFDANTGKSVESPGSSNTQEGNKFEYTKGDLKTPNNINSYIGFNEIYGSISSLANSPKPPKEVIVKKDRTYDIFVDQGSFSSCLTCGNDYYSQLNRIFPMSQFGGGLVPNLTNTSRTASNIIRADDYLFGRACFVPATMIPWSHRPSLTVEDQRKNRMALQHFYFANGYNRDWYGFDYGSVIGSFDGVRWFAIGSKRRIKADTNKLYIAINGYFADQTVESTFNVSVVDSSVNLFGDSLPKTDKETDGAECQKYHQCEVDRDCQASLGYDYVCSSPNELSSLWPVFDDNGNEIVDASREDTELYNILKTGLSATKRCIYRGRGSMCTPSYATLGTNPNNVFNKSLSIGHHVCSANTSCQPIFNSGGAPISAFNTRISRYAKTMKEIFPSATEDWFGLGAKILGRPLNYQGEESIPATIAANINTNKVKAICLPGRNPESPTYEAQNVAQGIPEFNGDRIFNIGHTVHFSNNQDIQYMNSCSVMDASGNYFAITHPKLNQTVPPAVSDPDIKVFASTQNISSNSLRQISAAMTAKGMEFGLLKSYSEKISTFGIANNSCMRAPGASCFTDQECAPNKAITDKTRLLVADTSVLSFLNAYELKFWQEDLICSQKESKSGTNYDPKNNRCCRDVGLAVSLAQGDPLTNGLSYSVMPGIDVGLNSLQRYTRATTVYQKIKSGELKDLSVRSNNCNGTTVPCMSIEDIKDQYKTLDYLGSKISCNESWVRAFSNNSRLWDANLFQKFPASMFKCLNWLPHSIVDGDALYSCSGKAFDDPDCKVVQTTPSMFKAKKVLEYLEKMELMGIAQIPFETIDTYETTTEKPLSCKLDPLNPYDETYNESTSNKVALGIFSSTATTTGQYIDITVTPNQIYYAGNKKDMFADNFKTIFKSDEIITCLPAGTKVSTGTDPKKCCSGFINGENMQCALNDFVDVSIYTNRYVSSEARSLSDTMFDNQTGYVKSLSALAELACLKEICASGVMASGVLISSVKKPGIENDQNDIFRFLENNVNADNKTGALDLYNAGLKLNNHLYCIPRQLAQSQNPNLRLYPCQ